MQSRFLNRSHSHSLSLSLSLSHWYWLQTLYVSVGLVALTLFAPAFVSQANALHPQNNSRPEFIRSSSPTSGGGSVVREAVAGNAPTTFADSPVVPRDNRQTQASEDERARSFYRQNNGVGNSNAANASQIYPYPARAVPPVGTGSASAGQFNGGAANTTNNPAYTTSSQWANTPTGDLGSNWQGNSTPRIADNRSVSNPTALRQAANQAPSLGNLGLGPVRSGNNGLANRFAPANRLAQANCNCNPLPAPPTQLQYNQGYQAAPGVAPNYGYQQPNCNCGPGGYAVGGYNSAAGGYAPTGYNTNAGGGYPLQNGIGVPQFGNQSSRWWTPFLTGSGQYTPLLNFRNMPPGTYLGQGFIGQPTAYVDGQPFRNLLRYVSP